MVLKKAISKRCHPPKTLCDLQAVIREEGEKIPIEIVQTPIESMPRRVKQVIKAQGYATKYWKATQYIFCIFCVNELKKQLVNEISNQEIAEQQLIM